MDYRFEISKLVENPNYDEEMKTFLDYERRGNYNSMHPPVPPSKTIRAQSLVVEITDTQFQIVRKAIIEKF